METYSHYGLLDGMYTLNGYKVHTNRTIDGEKQVYTALDAFMKNGYFVLIDNLQAESLEQKVNVVRVIFMIRYNSLFENFSLSLLKTLSQNQGLYLLDGSTAHILDNWDQLAFFLIVRIGVNQ